MSKKLYRSTTNKMLSGVCGGIAEYFNIDATIVRLIAVVILFPSLFTAVIAYFVCMIIIPEGSNRYDDESNYSYDDEYIKKDDKAQKKTKQVIGMVFIALGGLFLANELEWWFYDKELVWGIGIIAVGIFFLLSNYNKSQ